jgi:hypothetical protein
MINGVPRGRDLFLTGILFILADPSLADVDDNVSRSGPCPNKGHVLKINAYVSRSGLLFSAK